MNYAELNRNQTGNHTEPEWEESDKFSVRSYEQSGQCIVEVVGEITLDTTDILARVLHPCAEGTMLPLMLDLRQVHCIDSSGLGLLVAVSKRLRSRQVPFAFRVLVTPGQQPERVLRLGGFSAIMEISSRPLDREVSTRPFEAAAA